MNGQLPTDELRGLHLPIEPGWWPPAPGWWILAVLIGLLLVVSVVQWRKWRQSRRWQRAALQELKSIAALPSQNAEQRCTNRAALLGIISPYRTRVTAATYCGWCNRRGLAANVG